MGLCNVWILGQTCVCVCVFGVVYSPFEIEIKQILHHAVIWME